MTANTYTNETTVQSGQMPPSLLRTALRVDSVVSGLSGAAVLLLTTSLMEISGIEERGLLLGFGVFFLAWSALMATVSVRRQTPDAAVIAIAISNIVYGLGSVALAIADPFDLTVAGGWLLVLTGDLVLSFGVAQYIGLRRLSARR